MTSGLYTRAELLNNGMTEADLKRALELNQLRRIKHGWYATPMADSAVVEAVLEGGRLGCLSGCRHHGVWTPHHSEPHVIIPPGTPTMRSGWHRGAHPLPRNGVYSLEECLAQVVRHHDAETALTVLESATQKGMVSESVARGIINDASTRKKRSLFFFDPQAGSGSETRVRLFLRQNRYPVRSQVKIAGVGRVDLLVGRSLILECDSAAHHSDPTEDRRRDLAAALLGFERCRLSYPQIHHQWEETKMALKLLLSTRRHLNPPRMPRKLR